MEHPGMLAAQILSDVATSLEYIALTSFLRKLAAKRMR